MADQISSSVNGERFEVASTDAYCMPDTITVKIYSACPTCSVHLAFFFCVTRRHISVYKHEFAAANSGVCMKKSSMSSIYIP